ncbi:MAG: 6-phosphogluconolactonase [Panacagrimonas sp.]
MALTEHEFSDAGAAAQALAADVAGALREGIAERGAASLVISGGKSPVPFFHALREQPLDWSRTWITLADERWVARGSPDSNERLVRQHLITGAALDAHFVSLWTGDDTPIHAIAEVTERLMQMPRPFDAVVLGMGEDGHTASLFPGTDALQAMLDPRWKLHVGVATAPTPPTARITLTMRAVMDSRRIFLSIAGAAKRAVYEEARAGAAPSQLPIAAALRQTQVPVSVFLARV